MVAPVAIDALYERVELLLDGGETGTVTGILRRIHPADSSEILYRLPPDYQRLVLHELPWEEAADVLEELKRCGHGRCRRANDAAQVWHRSSSRRQHDGDSLDRYPWLCSLLGPGELFYR